MTTSSPETSVNAGPSRPVAVSPASGGPPARVAVLVVTWNRKVMVSRVLESLSRQRFPTGAMDVVVIDNASTDGTLERLRETLAPERVVMNSASEAHEPRFAEPERSSAGNTLGFGSLTIVRNANNFGGCGGFNTGFAWVESAAAAQDASKPDFLWLVDDDADVPVDALENLTRTAASDPGIGLVGSRTVDIADRETTIESTIYLDRWGGNMRDEPPPGHPMFEEHMAWVRSLGWTEAQRLTFGQPTRGKRDFRGVRNVEVVSACSMLVRWSAVVGTSERAGVGFWDKRYFIYCDDADWCLRFGKAGWRVVLSLDAVVFHTPWNLKLTPARIYYAQRNAIWMIQKVLPKWRLRAVTLRWMKNILRDSLRAAMHRRLFHAEIIRSTAHAAAAGIAGKTGSDGPAAEPVLSALERAGAARRGGGGTAALMITPPGTINWGEDLIAQVRSELAVRGRAGDEPRWTFVVRHDADGLEHLPAGSVVFGRSLRSRVKQTLLTARMKPDAVVVFDQTNDLPLLRGRYNVHIDMKKPSMSQLERDGLGPRSKFLIRWAGSVVRCLFYGATVRPFRRTDRYG